MTPSNTNPVVSSFFWNQCYFLKLTSSFILQPYFELLTPALRGIPEEVKLYCKDELCNTHCSNFSSRQKMLSNWFETKLPFKIDCFSGCWNGTIQAYWPGESFKILRPNTRINNLLGRAFHSVVSFESIWDLRRKNPLWKVLWLSFSGAYRVWKSSVSNLIGPLRM